MSYTLIQQVNSQHAHLVFNGLFMGNAVSWDTQLFTIAEYARSINYTGTTIKQLIEIEKIDDSSMKLTVVLNVPEINPPTIQKMMIMIKQYKRLSLGRHEYGYDIPLAELLDINN
jgi:hypothetical protein